jgi:VIT1/CCC1 family predicted Fe2+/Mn2+ transporter
MRIIHKERHRLASVGWLRAAVLGANDGIVSTSSLVIGVAAAHQTHHSILITGIAGLAAGAMSMATGEYVSVHSQMDTEKSALEQEKAELKTDPKGERKELVGIYVKRGLEAKLAEQVADQLMAHDALGAHARDELGITETFSARPVQAAMASAASFAAGALLPLLVVFLSPMDQLIPMISVSSLVFLGVLGGMAAKIGGANIGTGVMRVMLWSALAMFVTAAIGTMFGTVVR